MKLKERTHLHYTTIYYTTIYYTIYNTLRGVVQSKEAVLSTQSVGVSTQAESNNSERLLDLVQPDEKSKYLS